MAMVGCVGAGKEEVGGMHAGNARGVGRMSSGAGELLECKVTH